MLKQIRALSLIALLSVALYTPAKANQHNLYATGTVQPEACGTGTAQLVSVPPSRTPFLLTTGSGGAAGIHITLNNAPLGTLQGSLTTNNLLLTNSSAYATFSNGDTMSFSNFVSMTPTPNTLKGKLGAGASGILSANMAAQGFPSGTTLNAIDVIFYSNSSTSVTMYLDQVTYNGVALLKVPTAESCQF